MPTNVFFSPKVISEQDLFEDIIIESLKMYGQDVLYCPRQILTRDFILGEDVESKFDIAYTIEAYIENTEGFEGEGNLLSKFGMELRDEATFIISKRQWEKLVGFYEYDGIGRPAEGDIIYLPLSKSFFEISFVEHEQPFYQLNNLVVYRLQCRLFEYNEEDFNTGYAEIDQIEGDNAYTQMIAVNDVSGVFNIGERYRQVVKVADNGANVFVEGELTEFDGTLMKLVDLTSTDGIWRTFITDARISDILGEVSANVTQVYGLESGDDQTFANDLAANNYAFEQEADLILDFDELNPFGEPAIQGTATASTVVTVLRFDQDSITMDSSTNLMDNGEEVSNPFAINK